MTPLAQMSKQDRESALELMKLGCRKEFGVWFQSCARIKPKNPGMPAIIPRFNIMQQRIDEAIQWCDDNGFPARIVNLKPRQGGSSSVFIGVAYHRARSTNCNVAILGDDKSTTEKLMRMWRHYGENDAMATFWGNTPKNPHQPSWQDFTHGSNLTLETANDPRAGQGGTFGVLIASEVASYRSSGHSTGEDVFSSIAGCVPRLPKTLIALESTAQGQTGIFYSTYQNAVTFEQFKAGSRGNGFIKFFSPWFDFADYAFDGKDGRQSLAEWERDAILNSLDDREHRLIARFGEDVITPERLAWRRQTIAGPDCGGDPDKFSREYPSDDLECFRNSNSGFFDIDGLIWQEQQIIPANMAPKIGDIILQGSAPFFQPSTTNQGAFRIWENPMEGFGYVLSADFRVGRQAAGSKRELDANAVLVIRCGKTDPRNGQVTLPRVVASVREDDRTDTDIILQRLLCLHRYYGNCIVIPELNQAGNVIHQMQLLGITNIWAQPSGMGGQHGIGKTTHILGFHTNVKTRRDILDKMAAMVREQAFICSCPHLLTQMKAFVRKEDGKPEAAAGFHDDLVLATALGLWIIEGGTVYRGNRGEAVNSNRHWNRERARVDARGL